jgi:hypothetical protein
VVPVPDMKKKKKKKRGMPNGSLLACRSGSTCPSPTRRHAGRGYSDLALAAWPDKPGTCGGTEGDRRPDGGGIWVYAVPGDRLEMSGTDLPWISVALAIGDDSSWS